MYAKYQTDALVLNTLPHGEADTRITLFTREFGLIHARASSTRRESSRMRYGLQSYMRSRISLVRGSSGWRAAGAQSQSSLASSCLQAQASFARVARLVIRLVSGEEKNETLFVLLESAHTAFAHAKPEEAELIELLCVARILHTLGYLSSTVVSTEDALDSLFSQSVLVDTSSKREGLLLSINRALAETQL